MAITFDISYECSLLAQTGKLYYRYTRGSGVTTPWIYNTTLGVFPIDTSTCVGTPCVQTLLNVQGVAPDFQPNTAYEFKIEQTCSDGTIVDSPASDEVYVFSCSPFSLVVDLYGQGAHDMTINIYDITGPGNVLNPLGAGISTYNFDISWVNQNPPGGGGPVIQLLGTVSLDQGDILAYLAANPGATVYPFLVQGGSAPLINQSNGQAPFQQNEQYTVQPSFVIALSSGGSITYPCDRDTPITFPDCKQYRIYTGNNWVVKYKDCESLTDRWIRGSTSVAPFYICSVYPPIAGTCPLNGFGNPGPSIIQQSTGGFVTVQQGPNVIAPPFTATVVQGVIVETNLTLASGCDTLFDSPFPDYIINQGVTNFLVGPC